MTEEQQDDMKTVLRLTREENARLRQEKARTQEDVRNAVAYMHSEGALSLDLANRILETLGLVTLLQEYVVTAKTPTGQVMLSVKVQASSFEEAREEFWLFASVQVVDACARFSFDWSGPGERLDHGSALEPLDTTGLADWFAGQLAVTVTQEG